jgi:hypothetical protein
MSQSRFRLIFCPVDRITADDLRGDDMEKLLQRINPMIKGTK